MLLQPPSFSLRLLAALKLLIGSPALAMSFEETLPRAEQRYQPQKCVGLPAA